MTRTWLALLAGWFLAACDDGALLVFEPEVLTIGGSAGGDPLAQAGAGRGAAGTPDSSVGGGGTMAATDAGGGGVAGAESTSPLVIDDFEDGDPRAKLPLGWWYPVNDKSGAQGLGVEPISGDSANVYALRTHGSGFHVWGSAVGVDLVGEASPLDLRGYQKLCFRSRIEAGSSTSIQVHLLRGTVHYTQEVTLSEAWTRYCLDLVDFVGPQEAFVPIEISALQFFFTPTEQFLIWLDDVEVVRD